MTSAAPEFRGEAGLHKLRSFEAFRIRVFRINHYLNLTGPHDAEKRAAYFTNLFESY